MWLRRAGALLVLVAAALLATARRRELAGAVRLLAHVQGWGLAAAVGCEVISFLCLAALQTWLLRTGGVHLRLRTMAGIAAAANAIAGALPGGVAFSVAWVFRQLRKRGVGQVLAAAALVTAGVLATLALCLLLLLGALIAASTGPLAGLRAAIIAAAVILSGSALLTAGLLAQPGLRQPARQAWQRAAIRWRRMRRLEVSLAGIVHHARTMHTTLRGWLPPFALALLNWVCDAACLASALWALGFALPWRGLLLAYALTQVSGSLRLTPGSLGIVEASLAALLTVYGLRADQALAATFLYRMVSFWILQPIGWSCWLVLTVRDPGRPPPTSEGDELAHDSDR